MRSPLGSRAGYLQWMGAGNRVPTAFRLRHYANFVRYSLHAGIGWAQQLRDVSSAACWLGALPAGVALFWRDRLRLRPSAAEPAGSPVRSPATPERRS
jgi:hypothetical protein